MSDNIRVYVTRSTDHHAQAKRWCHEHVGGDWWNDEDNGQWSWTILETISKINGNRTDQVCYEFKSESKAVEFALRWK
jgi:hypothetical protein